MYSVLSPDYIKAVVNQERLDGCGRFCLAICSLMIRLSYISISLNYRCCHLVLEKSLKIKQRRKASRRRRIQRLAREVGYSGLVDLTGTNVKINLRKLRGRNHLERRERSPAGGEVGSLPCTDSRR